MEGFFRVRMTRAPCCVDEGEGLKKGPWTPDEDQRLVAYIQKHGHGSWRSLPVNAGMLRVGMVLVAFDEVWKSFW